MFSCPLCGTGLDRHMNDFLSRCGCGNSEAGSRYVMVSECVDGVLHFVESRWWYGSRNLYVGDARDRRIGRLPAGEAEAREVLDRMVVWGTVGS